MPIGSTIRRGNSPYRSFFERTPEKFSGVFYRKNGKNGYVKYYTLYQILEKRAKRRNYNGRKTRNKPKEAWDSTS